ncbi:non-ribosomal peptide synthetase [Allokutzneria albata]|uniref:Non-ribosomal peptide synthase domain TIGR01720/amino acid adenylation domain-containing protein n=1 Tax=Allokutzneria albata TaxID=211114 RepID=A0A1G9UCT7_ALLAB|nr:non-ribosomal peptide synthetase [Allokutzneria albata]SDM57375.1 non-ribosomal peptide synthase domain TIGR01720/amino acid adenylation domain-containing protein [Allokutzneria albata]
MDRAVRLAASTALSFTELFEAQVMRSPEATALAHDDTWLSYAELNARANRLARALVARGATPERLVALVLPRGPEFVISVLAALKAGAPFLPIDAGYPEERIEFLFSDAAPTLVVGVGATEAVVPAGPDAVRLSLDDPGLTAELAGNRSDNLTDADRNAPLALDNAAYVIYTSGSTGRPKGVIITHAGAVTVPRLAERFGLDENSRSLQFAPTGFDAALWDIFTPLFTGGAIVAAATGRTSSYTALAELLVEQKVTHATIPPAALAAMPPETFPQGVSLFLAGEAFAPTLLATWARGRTVVNGYGATEATICTTVSRPLTDAVLPPLGTPVADTTMYVLDERLRPVEPGAVGEAYIGGIGLARGYLNRPGLTAERFVANPFERAGGVMYRTGDLVRLTTDGEWHFVGRADNQVKIRGFRVELGEIELALAAHEQVDRAAVVVRRDDEGGQQLVAHLVAAGAAELDRDTLRAFLGQRLPDYMVPALFIRHDAFPLTEHGKIDRGALSAATGTRLLPGRGAGRTEAGTPTEQRLAEIWRDVLGLDSVGFEDDFFAQGGDSLRALRVLRAAMAAFEVHIPLELLFTEPTIAGFAAAIDALDADALSTIEPAPRSGPIPLSPVQERLWFLQEFDQDSFEYNVDGGLRFVGELDRDALRTAVDGLVAAHESLRLRFGSRAGRGHQTVSPATPVDVSTVDLSGFADAERRAEFERRIRPELTRPFDLRQDPPCRWWLFRFSDTEHVLVFSLHHIVTDGTSVRLMAEELCHRYTAAVEGRAPDITSGRLQYPDFAVWQRAEWSEAATARHLDYWRGQLAELSVAEVATDYPRPAVRRGAGSRCSYRIPDELAARLRQVGADADTTLFATLVAVVQVLLARYTGEQDIAVGTVTNGRSRPEVEHMLGFFINNLVLRSEVDPGLPFGEFLRAVSGTIRDGFAHQDVPFDRIVDALRVDRDTSRTPLFQAIVVLQNAWLTDRELPGARIERADLPDVVAVADLVFEFEEADGRLEGRIGYDTALFAPETIERMAANLLTLLDAVTSDADRPIAAIPALAEDQRRRIVVDFNDSAGPQPLDVPLHELFAGHVRSAPDATAVVYGDDRLSYAELDARSSRLAHHLIGVGVRPGDVVAICAERGLDLPIGLLAILKTGAAYLTVDAKAPVERTRFMIDDAGAAVAVVTERYADQYRDIVARVIVPDSEEAEIARQPSQAPDIAVTGDDLACVLFTSGSTGRPKGAVSPHRATVHALCETGFFELGPREVILQSMGVSWDGLSLELWSALLHGATLVFYPGDSIDADVLVSEVRRHGVTTLCLAAGLFNVLAESHADLFGSVRQVLFGGDVASMAHIRTIARAYPDLRLINGYGPVETMIVAACHRVRQRDVADGRSMVPIGPPLRNRRLYVVDAALRPVPIGVAGELYIGGPGVAYGYANRPDLTAERFVADPFGPPGSRLYRTGDLARWTGEGYLEFLGRADDQVKVRGFRIEPGEIETVLADDPRVKAAVVLVREDTPGVKRLVGYVAADEGAGVDAAGLRAAAANRLPDYMVPADLVVLSEFPLTRNGKLDRAALPAPTGRLDDDHVAPRTPVEREIARVWSEVLGVHPVGVTDNFFELGGDSILSLQVVSRAREAGLALSSRLIFRHQTVAELAAATAGNAVAGAERGPVSGPVPLLPIQRWYLDHHPDHAEHFNQWMRVDLLPGTDTEALHDALRLLGAHHDALRLRFSASPEGWRQELVPAEEPVGWEHHDLSDVDPAAREARAAELFDAAQRSFRLDHGPLLRAVVVSFGDEAPAQLLLAAHHLVMDAVSWRVLLTDLTNAYQQLRRGDTAEPPARTTSFAAWADMLATAAGAGRFDDEVDHWRAGAEPVPRDLDGANLAGTARTVTVRVDRADTEALLRLVPAVYRARIDEALLTVLGSTLAGWTGRADVLIDLEGHGREDGLDVFGAEGESVDLSRTLGWFTALYPVRLSVPGGADTSETLKSVKEQLRALPRRGLGYGALRYLTGAAVDVASPEISFNYLGRWDSATADNELFHGRSLRMGLDQHPHHTRAHLIDVVATVQSGQLELSWTYSPSVHHEHTVTALAEGMANGVRDLVRHCVEPGAGGCTPSDFPLAALDQAALDRIVGADRDVVDIYPLTLMQQGMLIHSLAEPEEDVYHAQVDFVLDGVSDVNTLGRAWQEVVDRLDILRTSLVWQDVPVPLQVVRRGVELPITYFDWSGLDAREQQEELDAYLATDRAAKFTLAEPTIARVAIAALSGDSVAVVFTFHHVLLDGWSVQQIFAELFAGYARLSGRDGAATPVRRRPFADYVGWLARQDHQAAEVYWRDVLDGLPESPALPYDREPVPGHRSRGTAQVRRELPPELRRGLDALTKRKRLTLNAVVQGAWALLLAGYSGQRDVRFGSVVSGRDGDLDGVEDICGLVINTIPVRAKVDGDRPVLDWLAELQDAQARSREFSYTSLTQLAGWLGADEAAVPGRTALFDSAVVFENYPVRYDVAAEHGLGIRDLHAADANNFPLTLVFFAADEPSFMLAYDGELFDVGTMQRLADHLTELLSAIVDADGRNLAAVTMLTAAERAELARWNDTAVDYPAEATLHELFERQASRTPDRTAVVCGAGSLTYRELDESANRLAHQLIDAGVGADSIVAIMLWRGLDMVVSMLAAHKAGGGYAMIDPEYPSERIGLMLGDLTPAVVVADQDLAERLPATDTPVLRVDADAEAIAARPSVRPDGGASADTVACVMFTSGSTGRPKGVCAPHRAMVRTFTGQDFLDFGGEQVFLQYSPMSWDAAQMELWSVLLHGGTTVLCPSHKLDLPLLVSLIDEHRVTTLWLSASLFNAVVDNHPEVLDSVRQVATGGEAASTPHIRAARGRHPNLRLVHGCGPVESMVFATTHQITAEDTGPLIPIGAPMPNTRGYVLDGNLNQVPVGVAGEWYIGGDGLARGYLGLPGLTAERFVADPFGPPGSRLYRTGDLVRWRPDGTMEMLGRIDDQVKIRGHRIEPGEIEAVLLDHPDVAAASVVVREDQPGVRRLTAYLVPAGSCDAARVRDFLADRLPDYLVPAAFVVLDALPLTSTGKVDRSALPEPEERGELLAGYVAPETPTEQGLARLWVQVLGVSRVGLDDNFFDLGGDSILTIRLLSEIKAAFGVKLSPRVVFDSPTVRKLAAAVETAVLEDIERSLVQEGG